MQNSAKTLPNLEIIDNGISLKPLIGDFFLFLVFVFGSVCVCAVNANRVKNVDSNLFALPLMNYGNIYKVFRCCCCYCCFCCVGDICQSMEGWVAKLPYCSPISCKRITIFTRQTKTISSRLTCMSVRQQKQQRWQQKRYQSMKW